MLKWENWIIKREKNIEDKKLELYQKCLIEIKSRILVIERNLSANKEIYSKEYKKFAQNYHAERILKDLERINPKFYPEPSKQIRIEGKEGISYKLEAINEGSLTKDEFVKVYEKCGSMLHAENPFGKKKEYIKIKEEFLEWLKKIKLLLSHHGIMLVDGKTIIIGLMKTEKNGLPQTVLFKRI